MTYLERLHPWCLIRLLPNARHVVVARFRRRNDALAHQDVLRRLVPVANYVLVYDLPVETAASPSESALGGAIAVRGCSGSPSDVERL